MRLSRTRREEHSAEERMEAMDARRQTIAESSFGGKIWDFCMWRIEAVSVCFSRTRREEHSAEERMETMDARRQTVAGSTFGVKERGLPYVANRGRE